MTERKSIDLTSAQRVNPLAFRLAKITTASMGESAPYTSVGGIYRGVWLDDETDRAPALAGAAIWTLRPTAVGDWILVVKTPFGRWESVDNQKAQTWDVQIALDAESEELAWRLTFMRAIVVRDPVTKIYNPEPNLVLPLDSDIPSSDYFCGVEFNLETMAATVTVSKTASDVYDTSIPAEYTRVRRLLYKLRCTVADAPQTVENSVWTVIADYRTPIALGVYI